MFSGRRHPNDDALVRRYMADRGMDAMSPADESVVRHVASCAPCAGRYDRLSAQLDAAARETREAADRAFSAERLVAQRERILRRIDGAGARVIAFPGLDHEQKASRQAAPLMRWVAVAAAAGLLIGVTVGTLLNPAWRDPAPVVSNAVVAARPTAPAVRPQMRPASLEPAQYDDRFLIEVDAAITTRSVPELEAIDALTLEARDFSAFQPRKD